MLYINQFQKIGIVFYGVSTNILMVRLSRFVSAIVILAQSYCVDCAARGSVAKNDVSISLLTSVDVACTR